MTNASPPDTPQIITCVGADVVMGLCYRPATHFGIIKKAPKPTWSDAQRQAWIDEAGGRCPKCGVELTLANTDIDHIFPRSKGGPNWGVNLRALCRPCNRIKCDDIELVTFETLRGTVLGDMGAAGFRMAADLMDQVKWSDIVAILARVKRMGGAIVVLAISHKAAILIVGGVVLVVAGVFAVHWLLEHSEGERRYVRLAHSLRESLSHLAHHVGGLARHLEGVSEQARRVQSGMGGLARHAGGVAGQVPARVGHAAIVARDAFATHAPTVADHASQLARDAGRVSNQVAGTAGVIAGHAGRVAARRVGNAAGQVPGRVGHMASRMPAHVAGTVGGGVARGVGQAQGAMGRLAGAVPRFGRRASGDVVVGATSA